MAFDFDTPGTAGLSSPAILEEDHNNSPRFERFRMTTRDKNRDKEGNMDRNDLRTPNRRGFNKDETETNGETGRTAPWTSQRTPRRSFGTEDGDRFRRGNSEMQKDRPQRYENFGRDRDRPNIRTKRDESSWILDDGRDRGDRDNNRGERDRGDRDRGDRERDRDRGERERGDRDGEHRISRDFRNFNRDRDHRRQDDDRNQRVEKDPEWLDAGPEDGETKGHSMEEFQRWKARMKASHAAEHEKKPKTPIEETSSVEEEKPSPINPPKDDNHHESATEGNFPSQI